MGQNAPERRGARFRPFGLVCCFSALTRGIRRALTLEDKTHFFPLFLVDKCANEKLSQVFVNKVVSNLWVSLWIKLWLGNDKTP